MNKDPIIKTARLSMYGLLLLLALGVVGGKAWEGEQHLLTIINLAIMASFFLVYFVGSYLSEEILFKGASGNLVTKKGHTRAYNVMLTSSLFMAVFFGILMVAAILK